MTQATGQKSGEREDTGRDQGRDQDTRALRELSAREHISQEV
ncbi:MAG: hypothetical protein QOC69_941, partial [Mycobacterium sp.]|nr:hypothetical protein [Mycobacterium sp.]